MNTQKIATHDENAPSAVPARPNPKLKPLDWPGGVSLIDGPAMARHPGDLLGADYTHPDPLPKARAWSEHERFSWGRLSGAERRAERDRVLDEAFALLGPALRPLREGASPDEVTAFRAELVRRDAVRRATWRPEHYAAEHEDEVDHEGNLLLTPPRLMLALAKEADACDACGADTMNAGPLCTRCASRAARPSIPTESPPPIAEGAAGDCTAGPVGLLVAQPAREAA